MTPMLDPLAVVFLILMIICAISVLSARDLLTAVMVFGTFSFFSATYFAILGAVDVAFRDRHASTFGKLLAITLLCNNYQHFRWRYICRIPYR